MDHPGYTYGYGSFRSHGASIAAATACAEDFDESMNRYIAL